MDEREFREAIEQAERALAGGDYYRWRRAMMTLMSADPSEGQWESALARLRAVQRRARAGRDHGGPNGRPTGCG